MTSVSPDNDLDRCKLPLRLFLSAGEPRGGAGGLGVMPLDQHATLRATEFLDDTMSTARGHRRLFRATVSLWPSAACRRPHHAIRRAFPRGESTRGGRTTGRARGRAPTAANLEFHARIVREKAILRRPDRNLNRHCCRSLRAPLQGDRAPGQRRTQDLPDLRAAGRGRLHPDQGDAVAHYGTNRRAPAQRQVDHRRAQRIQRPGRADGGVPACRISSARPPGPPWERRHSFSTSRPTPRP